MVRVYHAALCNKEYVRKKTQSSIEQKCAGMAKFDVDAFVTNRVKRGNVTSVYKNGGEEAVWLRETKGLQVGGARVTCCV